MIAATDYPAQRSVVVTGAGSGIGRSIAQLSAERGDRVLGIDLDELGLAATRESIEPARQDLFHYVAADACDAQAAQGALAACGGRFDRVDELYNIAGVMLIKPLTECSSDDVAAIMRVNVGSVVTMTMACLPRFAPGSVIINMASSAARKSRSGAALYGASKAAIVHLTRSLAVEFADRGVRVCAVSPGAVDTPMPRSRRRGSRDEIEADMHRSIVGNQLIHRLATPKEIASFCIFLASADGALCTGANYEIDGGSNAM